MRTWQNRKTKQWLRVVALTTALVFTFTTIAWADGVNLADSLRSENNLSPKLPLEIASAKPGFFESLKLSEAIGTIKSSHKGSNDQIVIHIQDAHVNEEAQRNIANILDYFAEHHDLDWVSLEGAQGELYTEIFSFIPNQKVREDISGYFLKEGRLTGPEYLAIVDRPQMKLYGVEDKGLYEQNREAYLAALDVRERDEEILAKLGKVLRDVSRFVFSDELRELVKRREAFQEGGRELAGYVKYLLGVAKKQALAIHDFAGMHSLVFLVELESQIDFEKAETELEAITKELKRILNGKDLHRFSKKNIQYRTKQMSRAGYFKFLEKEIQ